MFFVQYIVILQLHQYSKMSVKLSQKTLTGRNLLRVSLAGNVMCTPFWEPLFHVKNKVKESSYIAQYPVLRTVQSALQFTSLTDLFSQTSSQFLLEASSHMLQLMREGCSYTYPPLPIARYSFIQLSELEQC